MRGLLFPSYILNLRQIKYKRHLQVKSALRPLEVRAGVPRPPVTGPCGDGSTFPRGECVLVVDTLGQAAALC